MKAVRYTATVAIVLMSLMNLPFAFDDGAGIPKAVAWLVTLVGVAGIVAAVALLRNARWGGWAVTAIGAVNLAGAVVALVRDQDGAIVGLVLSAVITVLGAMCVRDERSPR